MEAYTRKDTESWISWRARIKLALPNWTDRIDKLHFNPATNSDAQDLQARLDAIHLLYAQEKPDWEKLELAVVYFYRALEHAEADRPPTKESERAVQYRARATF